jgi:hypothetical protein
MPGGKLHFSIDATESCKFWTEGVVSSGVAGFGLVNIFQHLFKSFFKVFFKHFFKRF